MNTCERGGASIDTGSSTERKLDVWVVVPRTPFVAVGVEVEVVSFRTRPSPAIQTS